MKEIRAYIESHRLEAVAESLNRAGISGLTAINAVGTGRALEGTQTRKVKIGSMEFLSCMKLEVICEDAVVDLAVHAILQAAWAGEASHGEIFVNSIERRIRINPLDQGLDGGKLA